MFVYFISPAVLLISVLSTLLVIMIGMAVCVYKPLRRRWPSYGHDYKSYYDQGLMLNIHSPGSPLDDFKQTSPQSINNYEAQLEDYHSVSKRCLDQYYSSICPHWNLQKIVEKHKLVQYALFESISMFLCLHKAAKLFTAWLYMYLFFYLTVCIS